MKIENNYINCSEIEFISAIKTVDSFRNEYQFFIHMKSGLMLNINTLSGEVLDSEEIRLRDGSVYDIHKKLLSNLK